MGATDPLTYWNSVAKECKTTCPDGYWGDGSTPAVPVCTACTTPCVYCTSVADCTRCGDLSSPGADELYLDGNAHRCVIAPDPGCPAGYFEDSTDYTNPVCSVCTAPCVNCDTKADECLSCAAYVAPGGARRMLDGEPNRYWDSAAKDCVTDCPTGFFEDHTTPATPVCSPCGATCLTCDGTADLCTKCKPFSTDGLFL